MHRRKRDIVVELTSLLDVILIMIFMVMSNNSTLVSDAQSELDQALLENAEQAGVIEGLDEQIAELLGELDDVSKERDEALEQINEEGLGDLWGQLQEATSRLEAFESIGEVATILNVTLDNPRSSRAPCLTFGDPADTDTEFQSFEARTDAEFSAAVNELRYFLSKYLNQLDADDPNSPEIYIMFSYNPDRVYTGDFNTIDSVLKDAESKANSPNFKYHTVASTSSDGGES